MYNFLLYRWLQLSILTSNETLDIISTRFSSLADYLLEYLILIFLFFFPQEAEEKDLYVKKADGGVYDGWCWPGTVVAMTTLYHHPHFFGCFQVALPGWTFLIQKSESGGQKDSFWRTMK